MDIRVIRRDFLAVGFACALALAAPVAASADEQVDGSDQPTVATTVATQDSHSAAGAGGAAVPASRTPKDGSSEGAPAAEEESAGSGSASPSAAAKGEKKDAAGGKPDSAAGSKAVDSDTDAPANAEGGSRHSDGWCSAKGGKGYWKNGKQVKGAWIVTDDAPYTGVSGSKRYWIDVDGVLAINRIIDPSDSRDAGAGKYSFATSRGYVATGKVKYKGLVLTPDAKGKLTSKTGFSTTSKYDGAKRLYYYVPIPGHGGASAAKAGYFKVGGNAYFGYLSKGYVCTTRFSVKGGVILASKDGRLAKKQGFVTSSAYNGGKKCRYYFCAVGGHRGYLMARTGFFKVRGSRYFANKAGDVVRNGYCKIKGKWYRSNAAGKLSGPLAGVGSMVNKAQSKKSSTKYLVMVSTSKFHMGVFKRSGGAWKLQHYWVCSVGKKATPTPRGTFKTYTRGYSFGNGFTCYWYTAFYGDYMMHSQTYYQNTFKIKGGSLGKRASHGCVRIDISHAKWVYYHLPLGTTVVTY